MASSFMSIFLFAALSGGASDLLDAVPSDEYWRLKNVQVTPESLAADLAAPAAAADLTKLINQLGDEDPAVRDAAATKIKAVGPGAVPQLEQGTKHDDLEVAARCRKLIGELKTGGKAEQVRRLIAIRTAGERKVAALKPRLAELAKADDAVVADYAAAAVAAIDGKPYARPHPATGDSAWLLPPDMSVVAHLGITGGRAATAEDFKQALAGTGPMFGGPPPTPEQQQEAARQAVGQIVGVAEMVGNVRLDGVTLGVSENVGPNGGHAIVLLQGRFDRKALQQAIGMAAGDKFQAKAVGGVDALVTPDGPDQFGEHAAMLFPDDERAAFVFGSRKQPLPLDAVAAMFKGNQQPLKGNADLAKLIARVDTKGPLWAVMKVTQPMREAPPLATMDWVTLSSTRKGETGLSFTIEGKAGNAEGAGKVIGMVNAGVTEAKRELAREMERGQQNLPAPMKEMAKAAQKLMETIKCDADAADPSLARMTGELDVPPTSLLGMTFSMLFGIRAMEAPAPAQPGALIGPAPAPPPAPVPPQP